MQFTIESENESYYNEIIYHNIGYAKGEYVVLNGTNFDELKVGKIQQVILNNDVYLVVIVKTAKRLDNSNCFAVQDHPEAEQLRKLNIIDLVSTQSLNSIKRNHLELLLLQSAVLFKV